MTARRNDERTTAGAHRMMRRADCEVSDPAQVAAIVASCKIIRIAYMDAEGLTIVPMNFGYVSEGIGNATRPTFYFHSAPIGRKIDAIKAAGNKLSVAFEMETDCEVVADVCRAIGVRPSNRWSVPVSPPSSAIWTNLVSRLRC